MASEQTETLINTAAAARIAKVNRCTIRIWERLGKLAAAAYSPCGHKLYREVDVLAVEKGKQPERRTPKNDWLKRLRGDY